MVRTVTHTGAFDFFLFCLAHEQAAKVNKGVNKPHLPRLATPDGTAHTRRGSHDFPNSRNTSEISFTMFGTLLRRRNASWRRRNSCAAVSSPALLDGQQRNMLASIRKIQPCHRESKLNCVVVVVLRSVRIRRRPNQAPLAVGLSTRGT